MAFQHSHREVTNRLPCIFPCSYTAASVRGYKFSQEALKGPLHPNCLAGCFCKAFLYILKCFPKFILFQPPAWLQVSVLYLALHPSGSTSLVEHGFSRLPLSCFPYSVVINQTRVRKHSSLVVSTAFEPSKIGLFYFMSSFVYSTLCLQASSTLLWEAVAYSFSLLRMSLYD